MLIVPDRFVLLATPRTGSRALEQAFEGIKSKDHHVHPEDLEETCETLLEGSSKLPKYTVTRNPYQHALSWYWHAEARHSTTPSVTGMCQFLKDRHISWYFSNRLNPYHAVADRILRYESNGDVTALAISLETGATIQKNTPRIGQRATSLDFLLSSREVLKAIEARFPEDIEFYNDQITNN